MPRAKLVSQKEYAERIGKSAQYVNKLVHQGVIRLVDRRIDVKQADQAVKATRKVLREAAKKKSAKKAVKVSRPVRRAARPVSGQGKSATQTLTHYRTEVERLKAQGLQLDNDEREKKLLPAAEVLKAEQTKNANIRMQFRRLPRNLAPMLARISSAADIEALVLSEIDRILEQLAADPFSDLQSAEAMAPIAEAEAVPEPIVVVPSIAEVTQEVSL